MNTTTASKTDFIKFNVSPDFKLIAEKKAKEYGMTLSGAWEDVVWFNYYRNCTPEI